MQMRLLAILLLSGLAFSQQDSGLYPPGLLPLINRANVLLSSGQFNEAVKGYSEAIEQNPSDYLLYYKRATAYYSLGRHGSSLEDFDKVLDLTRSEGKELDMAWLMKARVFLKEGSFSDCRSALVTYLSRNPHDRSAAELNRELDEAETLANKAENEYNAQLWNACIESSSAALRTASHSISIRETRMACEMAANDLEGAVGDLTRLSHLLPPSTTLLLTISRLSYLLLPSSPAALNSLKQCLHFDPDHKVCLSMHRQIKNLEKSFIELEEALAKEEWANAIKILTTPGKKHDLLNRFDELLKQHSSPDLLLPESLMGKTSGPNPLISSPRRQTLYRALCKSYVRLNQLRKAEPICQELLNMEGCSEDIDGLVGRAETLMKKGEWEEAVRLLQRAFEASGKSDRDVLERLRRAQKSLKDSKRKDYYKVLGVSRDADERTIKKAFRLAAKTAHPDKGGTEEKMAAVNEAYEVLSNPELRAQFDAGVDPNDPMSQQGGQPFFFQGGGFSGGHPFAQFFQQQGGGQGGSFQFHFSGGR